MKRSICLHILFLLCSSGLLAQSFTASVNKNNIAVGDVFQVSFTVEDGNMSGFQPPDFSNFNLRGGPNQSTNMQLINGQMSRSVSYSYYLQATKEGTFTIGPATANISGKKMESNSLSVTVGKSAGGNQGGQKQAQEKSIQQQISENVFLRVIVSDNDVYQGEQITVAYKLYASTNINIHNTSIKQLPSNNGFWAQEIALPDNNSFEREVYQGVQYNSVTVKKYALFPQRTGDLEIDPMEMETHVRVRTQSQRRGFFDDFFGSYKDIPYEFQSSKIKINVKPLPKGKPSSFSGLSGTFNMDVSLDKTETETDDPITMKIKISGKGNLRMLDAPKPQLPRDFEVFDPKTKEQISTSSNIISGYKQYDYLLIPRRPGTFKIPPMRFSYFDTKKEDYVELSSKEYEVTVSGEASAFTGGNVANVSKEEVELLGQDIRYIKSNTDLQEKGAFYITSIPFGVLFAAPFLLFVVLLRIKKREDELAGNIGLLKRKRAGKEAAKRLSKAKKLLNESGAERDFYKAVSESLWGYLSDRLNIPAAELSREKAEPKLEQNGVADADRKEIFEVLDKCEMALFAPTSAGDKEAVYTRAANIIEKIGNVLKT
ncbi:MAG: BatD family protein [Chitinophagales bacterium]